MEKKIIKILSVLHNIDLGLPLAGNFFSDPNWELYLEFKQCDRGSVGA